MIHKNMMIAIKEKNIISAYAIISTLLGKDRWLPELQTPYMCEYANEEFRKQGKEFWEKDDNKTEFPSKEKWDEDLWKLIRVRLERNFSKEKFDFLIEIMKYLRETGHPEFISDEKTSPMEQPISSENICKNSNLKKSVAENLNTDKPKPIIEQKIEATIVAPKTNSSKKTIIGSLTGGVLGLGIGAALDILIIGTIVGAAVGGTVGYCLNKRKEELK